MQKSLNPGGTRKKKGKPIFEIRLNTFEKKMKHLLLRCKSQPASKLTETQQIHQRSADGYFTNLLLPSTRDNAASKIIQQNKDSPTQLHLQSRSELLSQRFVASVNSTTCSTDASTRVYLGNLRLVLLAVGCGERKCSVNLGSYLAPRIASLWSFQLLRCKTRAACAVGDGGK